MKNETASQTKLTTRRGHSFVVTVYFSYGPNDASTYSLPDSVHANYESAKNRLTTIHLGATNDAIAGLKDRLEGGAFVGKSETAMDVCDVSISAVPKMNLI